MDAYCLRSSRFFRVFSFLHLLTHSSRSSIVSFNHYNNAIGILKSRHFVVAVLFPCIHKKTHQLLLFHNATKKLSGRGPFHNMVIRASQEEEVGMEEKVFSIVADHIFPPEEIEGKAKAIMVQRPNHVILCLTNQRPNWSSEKETSKHRSVYGLGARC
jgi:hypothetical protein